LKNQLNQGQWEVRTVAVMVRLIYKPQVMFPCSDVYQLLQYVSANHMYQQPGA
jgi:hypothetical protein